MNISHTHSLEWRGIHRDWDCQGTVYEDLNAEHRLEFKLGVFYCEESQGKGASWGRSHNNSQVKSQHYTWQAGIRVNIRPISQYMGNRVIQDRRKQCSKQSNNLIHRQDQQCGANWRQAGSNRAGTSQGRQDTGTRNRQCQTRQEKQEQRWDDQTEAWSKLKRQKYRWLV